jgi:AraC family transcriptional regulator of adaptative response/methylated-DNA-[protein]-cysteine methyltransferase
MPIFYSLAACPLSRLLLAGTDDGVCALGLARTDAPLLAALAQRCRSAPARRDDHAIRPWLRSVLEQLHGRRSACELPLDLHGTPFQQQVWQELRRIPYGATRTYRDVACAIGKEGAVRAVAGACAANPVAVLVPCHRVVRTDGGLGGYFWGLDYKVKLLTLEGHAG